MRNLRVLLKLLIASAAVGVIFLVALVYSIISTAQITSGYQGLLKGAVVTEVAASRLDSDIWACVAEVRSAAFTGKSGQYNTYLADANKQMDTLQKLSTSKQAKKAFQGVQADVSQELYTLGQVQMFAAGGDLTGAQELLHTSDPARKLMVKDVQDFLNQQQQLVNATVANERGASQTALILEVALAIAALLIGLVLIRLTAGMIARPIVRMAEGTKRIADGDLQVERLDDSSTDEVGEVAKSYNKMVEDLRTMIGRVRASAQEVATAGQQMASTSAQVASATGQIAATMQQLATGASEQSVSAAEAAHYMEQMRAAVEQVVKSAQGQAEDVSRSSEVVRQTALAIEQVARSAQDVSAAAARTLSAAETGGKAVRLTVDGIAQIEGASHRVAQSVEELGTSSQEIGAIVEVISSIADQTNLLALNAAIEAARAGEHGRGFAVVADEVRKLAESSGEASGRIAAIIDTIQEHVRSAVDTMAASSQRVREGTQMAEQAGQALDAILGAMGETNGYAQDISAAAEEVAASTAGAVESMEAVATSAQASLGATENMTALAERLEAQVQEVARISQDTAAAVTEVSASSEEIGASAEEIAGAAQRLAETAAGQKEVVSRFRV